MNEPTFDIKEAHRWFAIHCNNAAWDYLDKTDRTDDENAEMYHLAHVAIFHWSQVGTVVQHQRALCLLGLIYAELGHGSQALEYAEDCLGLVEKNAELMEDFDWAFASECVARAHAAAGNRKQALEFRAKAKKAGEKIADVEDRKIFDESFAARSWHGIVKK